MTPIPPHPQQQVYPAPGSSPHLIYATMSPLLKEAKNEEAMARRNARHTTKWFGLRPAHKKGYCQFCPSGIHTQLQVDATTGLWQEACPRCQHLLDATRNARNKVRRYKVILDRVHRRHEVVLPTELDPQYSLEADERAHLRELGWIHRDELAGKIRDFIKTLDMEVVDG